MKTLKVDQILDGFDAATRKANHVYSVVKVTNSTTPHIMDRLTEIELASYCDSDDWTVTIT